MDNPILIILAGVLVYVPIILGLIEVLILIWILILTLMIKITKNEEKKIKLENQRKKELKDALYLIIGIVGFVVIRFIVVLISGLILVGKAGGA